MKDGHRNFLKNSHFPFMTKFPVTLIESVYKHMYTLTL